MPTDPFMRIDDEHRFERDVEAFSNNSLDLGQSANQLWQRFGDATTGQ